MGLRKDITGGAGSRSEFCSLVLVGGARLPPGPPHPFGAGAGLGQHACGQLDGEGKHAVPLAATPKPAGIIYGADFLQVALWGDRADPSSRWGSSGRVSRGVWHQYRGDLDDVL